MKCCRRRCDLLCHVTSVPASSSTNASTRGFIGYHRPCNQFANARRSPHISPPCSVKVELGIGGVIEPVRPEVEFRCQRLKAGLHAGFLPLCRALPRCPAHEPEPFQTTHKLVFHSHFALDHSRQPRWLSFCFNRRRSTEVRRSTNLWVSALCNAHPTIGLLQHGWPRANGQHHVTQPFAALRHIGPGADIGQA